MSQAETTTKQAEPKCLVTQGVLNTKCCVTFWPTSEVDSGLASLLQQLFQSPRGVTWLEEQLHIHVDLESRLAACSSQTLSTLGPLDC